MKSLFSLEQYTKIFPRLKRKLSESSQYGKKLIELRKLRNFYEKPSQKYLQILYKKSYCPSQSSFSFFRFLESRLDVVLYRAHFFESIASAKQQIGIGRIEVNNKKVFSPAYNLLPGDIVQVLPQCKEILHANLVTKICLETNLPIEDGFVSKKIAVHGETKAKTNSLLPNFKECLTKKDRKKGGWRFQSAPFLVSLFKKIAVLATWSQKWIYKQNNTQFSFYKKIMPNNLLFRLSKLSFEDFLIADARKIWCSENRFRFSVLSNKLKLPKKKDYAKPTSLCLQTNVGDSIEENLKKESQVYKDSGQFVCKQIQDHKIDKSKHNLSGLFQKIERSNNFFTKKAITSDYLFTNKYDNSKNPPEISNWLFLNFILFLKKQAILLRKKSFCFSQQKNQSFFKKQSFFVAKKSKPLHLEISYRSRSIIFLYPPQRICFPYFIDLSQIYK